MNHKGLTRFAVSLTVALILCSVLAGQVTGQTFKTLCSFTDRDGRYLNNLILSGNTIYGTAGGGGWGFGTVFSVNTDGTDFTNVYAFTPPPFLGPYTNSDGGSPDAGVILSGNTLYGTTYHEGNYGNGTVFAVNTDGTGFITLHSFSTMSPPNGAFPTNSDGANPQASLAISGNTLYGTTRNGGAGGNGTVFSVNTDGSGFTVLYSFTGFHPFATNSDGAQPVGGLILLGDTLYGTAQIGGPWGNGTLFKLNTNGTDFETFYSFPGFSFINGAVPAAGLVFSGDSFYGTTYDGGNTNSGTVFKINTNGTGFLTLHSFSAYSSSFPFTNGDGFRPVGVILSGNTLYGTTIQGGSSGSGTVFSINTDGTDFTTLHSFTETSGVLSTNIDGDSPLIGAVVSGILYGTTQAGGSSGDGTVFSISLLPQLTITPLGGNLILAWPTNFTGYTLQSTTNLSSPVWTTNLLAPVVVKGQNFVTNPVAGTQQFFRLSQ